MTTTALLRSWRQSFGPLEMKMPDDGPGKPMAGGIHEDAEDRLNTDSTWGPAETNSPGGSGICFGYSVGDLGNVRVAEAACYKRHAWYDWEHYVRQFRYAHAAWEMTREAQYRKRCVEYGEVARSAWSETGPIYMGPGWVPQNFNQYHQMAVDDPHHGLPMNTRAAGWVAFAYAMRMKVETGGSAAFAQKVLDTCSTAAFSTGQVGSNPNTGGGALNQDKVAYCFHDSILAIGCCALSRQLGRSVPVWVENWAISLSQLEPVEYYGVLSPPAFVYSQRGRLIPATGEGQHGDPAFAWWGSLCSVLYRLTGSSVWHDLIGRYGPTVSTDEQTRKFTMLQRGILAP